MTLLRQSPKRREEEEEVEEAAVEVAVVVVEEEEEVMGLTLMVVQQGVKEAEVGVVVEGVYLALALEEAAAELVVVVVVWGEVGEAAMKALCHSEVAATAAVVVGGVG